MWFPIALIGYILLALVFILDKLIVSKAEVKPAVYTFYSAIFMFGALLLLPFFGFGVLAGIDWFWAVVSGLSFGFGLWTMYLAVKKGEASHINPFNGAMVTIFIYLFASYFLKEKLLDAQIAGMAILIFASLLLSFEKSRQHSGFHSGFVWAIISGLFFAASHVSAKYLYGIYPFWTAFIWTRATTGLVGIMLLMFPAVRHSFRKRPSTGAPLGLVPLSHHEVSSGRRQAEPKTYARRHAGLIVVINKILAILAVVLVQYAMSLGSVILVGALSGLQYVLLFVLIYLLTKFLPKVFKEYFTKREIAVEIIAIALVAMGSVMFVL